jgi:hypothetical protein
MTGTSSDLTPGGLTPHRAPTSRTITATANEVVEKMKKIDDVFSLITKSQHNSIDAKTILEIIFDNNEVEQNPGQDIIQNLKSFEIEYGTTKASDEIFKQYEILYFFEKLKDKVNTSSPQPDQANAIQQDQAAIKDQKKIDNLHTQLELVLNKLNLLKYSYIYEDPDPETISINKKKYYTLKSNNKEYYTHDKEKNEIADRTKIAYSPTPDGSSKTSSDGTNQHDNPPQLSPRFPNKKITGEASKCVMDAMRESIKSFSNQSAFTKLTYFLIAIKLQGINNNEKNFNKLLRESGENFGDSNYKDAKQISKLFQEQSKEIGLFTGRVSEYHPNIEESKIVGMRTKRIPLVLVMELAKEMLKPQELNLFKGIKNNIFEESLDKYPHPPVPVGRRRNPSSRQEGNPVIDNSRPQPMEPSDSLTTDSTLPSSTLTPDISNNGSRSSSSLTQ